MIENSFVIVSSDGKQVEVRYMEDQELREGPAIFPARYPSFAAIITYCDTNFGPSRKLTLTQRAEIQGLLGSPWPAKTFMLHWKDTEHR